jgi:hypothetical protein
MTRKLRCAGLLLMLGGAMLAADRDHDGIPDDWETNGVTVTLPGGRTRYLDLPHMGASPDHKDIIVWINWMRAPDHSHKPIANTSKAPDGSGRAIEQLALDRIKSAFLNRGINLILIYADDPLDEVPQIGDTDPDGNYLWDNLDTLTRSQFPIAPDGFDRAVHLCTFIHQMSGQAIAYTGLAKTIPGREFLVSLGGSSNHVGSADSQEGTFMHELGHDLGLKHGGADDILLKPNYLSVMNYLFQVTGLQIDQTFGNFDYSDHKFDFDERTVDGRRGVTTDKTLSRYGSAEVCDPFFARYRYFASVNSPIRWDCTNNPPNAGPAPKDVNKDGSTQLLTGWHDWNSIALAPFAPGAGAPILTTPQPTQELPLNRIAQILAGLTVPSISVTRQPNGINIQWQGLSLDSVVAYELLRTRPGGHTDIIRQTKKNQFLDTTAQPGVAYAYRVRMVFNGLSSQAIDEAAATIQGVAKMLTEAIRTVIPLRQRLNDVLMRGRASAPVYAAK